MAKRKDKSASAPAPAVTDASAKVAKSGKPLALPNTRVIYCGDNPEQLAKLPDAGVDLMCIDQPFNSNRNYDVFWGETSPPKEERSFEDRHADTQGCIDHMRPRCQQLAGARRDEPRYLSWTLA